jgi:hypothetical protein
MGRAPESEEIAATGPTSRHNKRAADVDNVHSKLKLVSTQDGDTAMALFADPEELHEAVDPQEERKLLRSVDLMILPYLAVCYAFFYIDKVGFEEMKKNCGKMLNFSL